MARGKQARRHARKRKRRPASHAASTAPAPLNDSNRFLSLPPELIDAIVDHLPTTADLHSLLLTSKALHHRYRLRFVVERFQDCASLTTVYYLEGALPGRFGWKCFTIVNAQLGDRELMEEEERDYAFLSCVEHNVAEFRKATPTRSYLIVEVYGAEVTIDNDYLDWLETAPERLHDWDSVFRGRLRRVTPELLKARFGPCPECQGSEEIVYGRPDVAQRWPAIPENEYYFEFDGPCPRCTYSYCDSIDFYEETLEEMEQFCMEEYEERMMEQMAEEMYGMGLDG